MEMEGSQKIDLEVEDDGLIDNNHFSENEVGFNTHDSAGTVSTQKEVDSTPGICANDHLPELHESTEPAQSQRNGRYNLRKSLAWDSAFFTSAGVLDPEELSSMITGPVKAEKHFLPGIQEEITGSTESISTLESDNLTLETLEDDLFVDIRASIQRSSKKAMSFANSNSKAAAIEVDSAAVSSLKKGEVASQSENPKPGLKKSSGLQTGRMSKSQPKQNTGKLGSAKAIKHDSGRLQTPSISKIGETNSLLPKPPKTTGSSIPSSTTAKRDSPGTGRAKSECGSSKLGGAATAKGSQPSKVSVLSGARRVLPKPAVSSKSSLLGSLTTAGVQSMGSSTSSDSSSNISSGTPVKSTLATARRNPGKSGNVGTGPSGSIPRTPSRVALKNKPPPSTLSTYLKSAKISSNVSPASSISEWSSASSTSSIMLNQRSNNPRISLDTSSRRSTDSDSLDLRNHSVDRTTGRHENQGTNLTTSNPRKSSTQTGTLQAPVKPSGLRMPSPKIGFFDGVKSSGRTPNGQQQSQSGLRTLLPKNGAATCSPKQSSNSKVKSAKVQTPRTGTSLARMKPGSPKITSPASSQAKSHALVNTSSVSTDVKDSPSLSSGVKANAIGESCPNAEEVQAEDGDNQVLDAGAIIKENLSDLNMHKNMGTEDIKTASIEGGNAPSSAIIDQIDALADENHPKMKSSPICEATDKGNNHVNYQGEAEIIDQMDALVNENHLKAKPHPIWEATDKENSHVNYQGEMLTGDNGDPFAPKNFSCSNESIDMSKELAIDVAVADKPGFVLSSSEQKIS